MPWDIYCPYCGQKAKLKGSAIVYNGRDFGWIWDCRPCDAYVGVHKDSSTFEPKGTLANKELREWRKAAHAAFDPIWQSGQMTRKQAYRWLSEQMNLTEAHIGEFDIEQCRRLIEILSTTLNLTTSQQCR